MTTPPFAAALAGPATSRRALLAAAGLAALGAAGCSGKGLPGGDVSGQAGSGTGTIQCWTNHSEEDDKLLIARTKVFTDANPEINVKLLNIAGTEYYTKINTAAVGGGLADVLYTRTFDIAPFVARDYLLPLGDLINRDKDTVKPDDFWPAEVAQLTVDGQMYALPYDFSNFAIYVNKTMLEKAGVAMPTDDWTWEDFFRIAAPFVQKSGKRQTRWGAAFTTSDWFMMGVFKAYGGATFSDDLTSCVVSSDTNVAVLQLLADQMSQGVIPTASSAPTNVDIFASQLAPFKIDGSWATLATRAAVNGKFDWDVVRLPKGSTGKREVSTAGGSWGISKASKNQSAAWKFVEFIANEDSDNALIADVTRSIPGRQSSAKKWQEVAAAGKLPPDHVDVFAQQMTDDAVNWAYPKFWSEFDVSWAKNLKTLGLSGQPKSILDKIQADANAAAKRY